MRFLTVVFLCFFILACNEEVVVKPAAKLRLEYPENTYKKVDVDCPYSFNMNANATLNTDHGCNLDIDYPAMNATIYLTYQSVKNHSIDSLLYDAQKLTYDHTIKANKILEQPRVDSINNVYGMFYMIDGNAATQSQFYVTDSVKHFITGSLYFKAKPNFDSIYPAVMYLRKDIRVLMETMEWQ
ncbi:gliding motility lipoprotein GldD [Marixanthomonas spongiae]|uniref:Gliding motility lipoprotein GldD n=1 Tax=Marixanthomonas spongiae TaxID=2174845 RepID=A0A2U0I8H4_9FLAO|nr:gliding motility lipoprotein GldD [Marixanthomonas spongiae]PVW17399.1 gliding motility lipoprotein GldD [Marixanthomonas spongiae]